MPPCADSLMSSSTGCAVVADADRHPQPVAAARAAATAAPRVERCTGRRCRAASVRSRSAASGSAGRRAARRRSAAARAAGPAPRPRRRASASGRPSGLVCSRAGRGRSSTSAALADVAAAARAVGRAAGRARRSGRATVTPRTPAPPAGAPAGTWPPSTHDHDVRLVAAGARRRVVNRGALGELRRRAVASSSREVGRRSAGPGRRASLLVRVQRVRQPLDPLPLGARGPAPAHTRDPQVVRARGRRRAGRASPATSARTAASASPASATRPNARSADRDRQVRRRAGVRADEPAQRAGATAAPGPRPAWSAAG